MWNFALTQLIIRIQLYNYMHSCVHILVGRTVLISIKTPFYHVRTESITGPSPMYACPNIHAWIKSQKSRRSQIFRRSQYIVLRSREKTALQTSPVRVACLIRQSYPVNQTDDRITLQYSSIWHEPCLNLKRSPSQT